MVTDLESKEIPSVSFDHHNKNRERFDKKIVKTFEKIGCRFKRFGDMYHKMFYRNIVENELELADLEKDDKIIVVGCGPLPMTVCHLAEKGYDVTGLDRDPDAIRYSKEFTDGIKFVIDDGRDFDYSEYDAVWIPFHVEPKDSLLCKIFKEIKKGGKVVYRVPRNHLKYFYPSVDVSRYTKDHCCVKNKVGKKSVIAVKEKECQHSCPDKKRCTKMKTHRILKTLTDGEEAIVKSCPNRSCLNALGLREGKKVKIESRQPLGGPLLVSIEGRKMAIDRGIAENIKVA